MSETIRRFVLRLYAKDGVAAACLHLQSRHEANVNLLLFGAFVAATRERALDAQEAEAAAALIAAWHAETVLPLRGVRSWLKGQLADDPAGNRHALRERVKAIEIEAELLELDQLAAWLAAQPDRPRAPAGADAALHRASLLAALGTEASALPPESDAALAVIAAAGADKGTRP
jgi:uncharacterized protein (TIGR02444 family)